VDLRKQLADATAAAKQAQVNESQMKQKLDTEIKDNESMKNSNRQMQNEVKDLKTKLETETKAKNTAQLELQVNSVQCLRNINII
jgi:hypothetical protein